MSDECAMAPLPKNDPCLIAWERYKQTEDFVNIREWASDPEHLIGSLWDCFLHGYRAAETDAGRRASDARIAGSEPQQAFNPHTGQYNR